MSSDHSRVKLIFLGGFTERDEFAAKSRGYRGHVFAEIDGVHLYPLYFYDTTRLQQDLHENEQFGRPFITEPGMIVLNNVTYNAMYDAVCRLFDEGYFDHLRPVDRCKIADWNSNV